MRYLFCPSRCAYKRRTALTVPSLLNENRSLSHFLPSDEIAYAKLRARHPFHTSVSDPVRRKENNTFSRRNAQKRPQVANEIEHLARIDRRFDHGAYFLSIKTHPVRVRLTIGARRGRAARGRPIDLF
ncbi:hypothetical protein L0664_17365 [Octadecabacter sp. G9-8]|uniref:Uncharacterized protein n=1 Tax=Octadecabacter dasysiphoniae TaxID=2909341 RepID=A0ABS9CZY5_9RHOB|nr:hypothetical protein [Octadecabacter dasysiphoniae]MCF2872840.1 hypothetical protein [Octadecabacter dasysiphoniae]